MSDEVHFLAVQFTEEPSSFSGVSGSSGVDGFTFPLRYDAPDVPSNYPIRVRLNDCIKYWWRVKKWRLTHSVSGGSFGGTYGIPQPYDFLNLDNPHVDPPSREREIRKAIGTNVSLFLPSEDDSGFVFQLYPPTPAGFLNKDSLYRDTNNHYFPWLIASGQLLGSVFSTEPLPGLEAQSLLVTIDERYELPTYSIPSTADFSGYLHIDPLEYWWDD